MAYIPISDRTSREFGRLVERLIDLSGLNKNEIAERIGVSKQLVTQITQGHIPNPEIIQRLSEVLGITYFELWMAAFHELIPEGYELVPADPREREQMMMPRFMAEHPEFARLYETYAIMPPDERDTVLALLEALFSGRRAEQR